MKQAIVWRQAVEEALKKSEQHYRRLLAQSRQMQEQLRHLSRAPRKGTTIRAQIPLSNGPRRQRAELPDSG